MNSCIFSYRVHLSDTSDADGTNIANQKCIRCHLKQEISSLRHIFSLALYLTSSSFHNTRTCHNFRSFGIVVKISAPIEALKLWQTNRPTISHVWNFGEFGMTVPLILDSATAITSFASWPARLLTSCALTVPNLRYRGLKKQCFFSQNTASPASALWFIARDVYSPHGHFVATNSWPVSGGGGRLLNKLCKLFLLDHLTILSSYSKGFYSDAGCYVVFWYSHAYRSLSIMALIMINFRLFIFHVTENLQIFFHFSGWEVFAGIDQSGPTDSGDKLPTHGTETGRHYFWPTTGADIHNLFVRVCECLFGVCVCAILSSHLVPIK